MSKRKLIVAAFVLVVMVTLVDGVRRLLISPADGVIKPAVSQPVAATVPSQPITVINPYAQFSYPSKFNRLASDPPVAPVVASYSFIKQQIGSWQISILLTKLASGQLTDDGGYNYRTTTPSRYSRENRTIGGQPVILFTDKSSPTFSKVGYLHHGNIDASISFMGGTPSTMGQLRTDLDALIASWQWR